MMNQVKAYKNGFRVNGGRLQRYFLTQGEILDSKKSLVKVYFIYARDYEGFSKEIRELFDVSNGTDVTTDYCEKDRIVLDSTQPHFKSFEQVLQTGKAVVLSRFAEAETFISIIKEMKVSEFLAIIERDKLRYREAGFNDDADSLYEKQCVVHELIGHASASYKREQEKTGGKI